MSNRRPPRDVNSRNVAYQNGRTQRAHYDKLRTRADASRRARQVDVFAQNVRLEMLDEFPPEERERLMHVAEHGTPREQRRVYAEVLLARICMRRLQSSTLRMSFYP